MTADFKDTTDLFRGFTMVEVLVALVLLSVGILGTATLMGAIISKNNYASQISTAVTLAQDKIEALKNTPYSRITGHSEIHIDSAGNPGGMYTRTTSVDTTGHAHWTEVAVTVTWIWKGAERNVVLKTIIAE